MSETDSLTLKYVPSVEADYETKNLKDIKIGIIGAGKLAYAIACGIIVHAGVSANNICVSAKTAKNLSKFREMGCEVTKRNYDIFTRFDCHIVFLCFNSSVIKQCYRIGSEDKPIPFTINYIPVPDHNLNVLSLISGVTSDQIFECLVNPRQTQEFTLAIHRLVLSTAVAYGRKCGFGAIDTDLEKCDPLVIELLSSISTLETMAESEMDNFCSFSTSGLLFSYYYSSGLSAAALNLGLQSKYKKMSAYAMLTAADAVLGSGKSPMDLFDECLSISSNTLPAIYRLKDLDIDWVLETAFDAICKRIQVSND